MRPAVIKKIDQMLKSGKRVVIEYNKKTDVYYIGITKMIKIEGNKNDKEV
mgnify:CR=1 FL=1